MGAFLKDIKIKVIGVGGGGNNAINRMTEDKIDGVEFWVMNTDNQVLRASKVHPDNRIQLGGELTKGMGAGADPEVGRLAAEESIEDIRACIQDADLVFIASCMGGGTGTGASPVVARIAKEMEVLTIAVVTKPFDFEGKVRYDNAIMGITNLKKYVDTMVVIANNKLLQTLPKGVSINSAFKIADDVLQKGIKSICDLIIKPSLINLDFADVKKVMKNKGMAHMGIGSAKGENRTVEAVRRAVSSPLLETTIEGATAVIVNVSGGLDLPLDAAAEAATLVKAAVDENANIIFGTTIDENLKQEVVITVIATGFEEAEAKREAHSSLEDFSIEPKRSASGMTIPGFVTGGHQYKPQPQAEQPMQPQQYQPQYVQPQPQPQVQPKPEQQSGIPEARLKSNDDPSIPPFLKYMKDRKQ